MPFGCGLLLFVVTANVTILSESIEVLYASLDLSSSTSGTRTKTDLGRLRRQLFCRWLTLVVRLHVGLSKHLRSVDISHHEKHIPFALVEVEFEV